MFYLHVCMCTMGVSMVVPIEIRGGCQVLWN